ncbi:MAG TPA: D-alanine--D-alanine ligase, partial [Parachlamydiaceae bacterium]|nr:D-alanine--D-alanine ligase [Parachlamydiaceae bacterium]
IYAAREKPIPGISHESIMDDLQKELKKRCKHVERARIADELAAFLRPHDVFVSLGAGDITHVSGEILEKLALKPPTKLKLGLIFGGMSVEHDISLISSANIHAALDPDYYDIEQFGITRQGDWLQGSEARKVLQEHKNTDQTEKISAGTLHELLKADILFPVLHGTCGEDGTIQGLFDVFSKAYVGCDHRSSAICMDKELSKRLALAAGVPALPFLSINRYQWETSKEELVRQINEKLTYPVFVKPVHLGSSIGVHKVTDAASLSQAIMDSFRVDDRLIVENGLENMREIEFSLLGNDNPAVFPGGEVYAGGNVHDYDSKYGLNPTKAAAHFDTIAKLSDEKNAEGMALAKTVYQTMGCSGMARVDTFLDANGKFWFNEINPIPGFTKFSLYPLMCQANGLALHDLVDWLIVLGMHRRRQLDRLEVTK